MGKQDTGQEPSPPLAASELEDGLLFRKLFERIPALVSAHRGSDHVVVYRNRHFGGAFGDRRVVGRAACDALPELGGGGLFEHFDEVLRTGRPAMVYEYPVDFGEGSSTWLNWTIEPWIDNDACVGVLSFGHDVSEIVRSREDRQRTGRLLAAIVDSCPDAIWAKDRDGRISFANRAMARTLPGASRDELVGLSASDLFDDPALVAAVDTTDRRIMSSGSAEDFEEIFGGRIYQTVKAPLRDETGGVEGIVGFSRDITARKTSDAELIRSRELLRLALEAGRLGVWDIDIPAGRAEIDETTRDIHGTPDWPKEVPLETADALVLPEDLPALQAQRRHADESGRFSAEYRIRRPDGEVRWLAASGRVRTRPDGTPVWAVGVLGDITGRKQAEEALRESERRLQRERAFLDTVVVCVPVGVSVARDPMRAARSATGAN